MEGESSSFKAPISFVDIHILVVDDDPIALAVLSAMLRTWKYQVVTAKNPFEALHTLRMKKGLFDLVISDLHMPQMNGLELQNKVRQEFDLPVVMISADEKESVILESLEKGAAFYIVKPVKVDDLKHVWQYAVAAKKGKSKVSSLTSSIAIGNYVENDYYCVNMLSSSFGNDESKRFKLKRKASSKWCKEKYFHHPKRAKVVWTNSLHNRFLHAIRQIGLHKAVPKRILEFMNVPGLTRENVASHLQKYRLFLKRVTDDGFFPIQEFSDITSGTSFAPFLPSVVSKNVQPSHKEFPKHQLRKQPSKEKSNPPNPNYSLFSTQKALVGSSITHLGHGQVLKFTKFHPSDVPTHYRDDGLAIKNPHMHQNLSFTQSDSSTSHTQRPDMFINYPSMHFESIANNPNFSSSSSPFSNNVFAEMRTNNGEDKLMITTGQLGFNCTIIDQSCQFLARFPSINQYDDTVFVQASPLQSYDPRNEDVLPYNCINLKEHLIGDDVCRLFMEENNNQSAFEQKKDEEERLSDLYNVFNEEPNPSMKEALHSDICSSNSTKEGGSTRKPQPLAQLDENKDVRIVKNMDPSDQYKSCSVPFPHQPSKQIEEEIPNFEIHGLRKEENGAVASPNEGWDEDLLEILFGDNESERDLEIHLSEIFSKS